MTRIIHESTTTVAYDAGTVEGEKAERQRIIKIIRELPYYLENELGEEMLSRDELIKLIEK